MSKTRTITVKVDRGNSYNDYLYYFDKGLSYFEMLKQRQIEPGSIFVEVDGEYINFILEDCHD